MRLKEDYDGAEPSGNSIAVMNLLRLAQMTERDNFSGPLTGLWKPLDRAWWPRR